MVHSASVRFLETYSDLAVGPLTAVIQQGNEMQAVQAMRALAFLGTYDALDLAATHADSMNESRGAVRLWAAKASGQLVRRMVGNAAIPVGQLNSVVTQLSRAALAEDDWLTLHWTLDALFAADTPAAHTQQIRVFERIVERITSSDPPDVNMVWVARRGVIRARELYLAPPNVRPISQADRTTYVSNLAPVLGDLLTVTSTEWAMGQADRRTKRVLADAILTIETMLSLADSAVRPAVDAPTTSLHRSWQDGNESGFKADVNRWNAVLSNPPYVRIP